VNGQDRGGGDLTTGNLWAQLGKPRIGGGLCSPEEWFAGAGAERGGSLKNNLNEKDPNSYKGEGGGQMGTCWILPIGRGGGGGGGGGGGDKDPSKPRCSVVQWEEAVVREGPEKEVKGRKPIRWHPLK